MVFLTFNVCLTFAFSVPLVSCTRTNNTGLLHGALSPSGVWPVNTGFSFYVIIIRPVCFLDECFHCKCLRNSAQVQFTCCFHSYVLKCASGSTVMHVPRLLMVHCMRLAMRVIVVAKCVFGS